MSVHTGTSRRQCPFCDRVYSRADGLKRHLLSKRRKACADFVLGLVNAIISLNNPPGEVVERVQSVDALSPEVHFQEFVPFAVAPNK